MLGRGVFLNIAGTDQLVLTDMERGHYFIIFSPLNASGYRCSEQVGFELTFDMSPR